jgi:hypothetical protein
MCRQAPVTGIDVAHRHRAPCTPEERFALQASERQVFLIRRNAVEPLRSGANGNAINQGAFTASRLSEGRIPSQIQPIPGASLVGP